MSPLARDGYCGLGTETIVATVDSISLLPGIVRTDLQEIETALATVSKLQSLSERLECLRDAAALLRGDFLEGYSAQVFGDGWLESMRFESAQLSSEVWLQLARVLDESGERRSAFGAARKAYALQSHTTDTLELLLDLADGALEHNEIRRMSQSLGVEGFIPHIQHLQSIGQDLNISEENALADAIRTRLGQLSESVRDGLIALSGFPQDFTLHQASEICGIDGQLLSRIYKSFPIINKKDRYGLFSVFSKILNSYCGFSDKQNFQKKHAEYFYLQLFELPRDIEELRIKYKQDEENFILALKWQLDENQSERKMLYVQSIWCLSHLSSKTKQEFYHRKSVFLEFISSNSREESVFSMEIMGAMAMDDSDFIESIRWFKLLLENDFHDEHAWSNLLFSAHHAQKDEVFDETIVNLRGKWQSIKSLSSDRRSLFLESTYRLVAENRYARRNYIEALAYNKKSFDERRNRGAIVEDAASLWAQRGAILKELKRFDESRMCWDKALRGFESKRDIAGIAECYCEIGNVACSMGLSGLGISLIRLAISKFRDVNNQGGVAAASGSLGDALLELGDESQAHDLYEEGLTFWKERKHPRWTEKFENRLQRLQEHRQNSCKTLP